MKCLFRQVFFQKSVYCGHLDFCNPPQKSYNIANRTETGADQWAEIRAPSSTTKTTSPIGPAFAQLSQFGSTAFRRQWKNAQPQQQSTLSSIHFSLVANSDQPRCLVCKQTLCRYLSPSSGIVSNFILAFLGPISRDRTKVITTRVSSTVQPKPRRKGKFNHEGTATPMLLPARCRNPPLPLPRRPKCSPSTAAITRLQQLRQPLRLVFTAIWPVPSHSPVLLFCP